MNNKNACPILEDKIKWLESEIKYLKNEIENKCINVEYYRKRLQMATEFLDILKNKGFNPSTIKIGNKLWMSENLAYDDGGEGITYNPNNKEYYYTWKAANRVAKKLGWKLPTAEDWNKAAEECGDICTNSDEEDIAFRDYEGGNLKEKLKVKLVGLYYGSFRDVGSYDYFWTSSEYSGTDAYSRYFSTSASMDSLNYSKYYQYSVRLVKDI